MKIEIEGLEAVLLPVESTAFPYDFGQKYEEII